VFHLRVAAIALTTQQALDGAQMSARPRDKLPPQVTLPANAVYIHRAEKGSPELPLPRKQLTKFFWHPALERGGR
jgi:hypothetical protein